MAGRLSDDELEDEGHGAAKKRNRVKTDLRLLRFLRRHLAVG